MLILLIIIIGVINKTDTFKKAYIESLIFLEIMNAFDGIVIDKIWVAYAKLWKINGMEGVPYVQSWKQMLTKRLALALIWVPLAMPSILAGIRLAIISTTGIATIAATINAGGIGKILLSGLRTMNTYKIIWGTLLNVIITLVADMVLKLPEKKIKSKSV